VVKRELRATTVVAVRKDGRVAVAGDGQVTMGDTVVKTRARKVRELRDGTILAGFGILMSIHTHRRIAAP